MTSIKKKNYRPTKGSSFSYLLSPLSQISSVMLDLCVHSPFLLYSSVQSDCKSMASTSSSTVGQIDLQYAFDGIAPTFTSPRSTLSKRTPYDIFINHRGPDVKDTLATAIYNRLDRLGLRVFLDKKALEAGDLIPPEIEAAMRSASLHIAIFSKNYAQSPWCLAELAFMLKTGATIIPVFDCVEPSDLRGVARAKGVYADAFKQHEEKGRHTEKLQEWKGALEMVSYHFGYGANDEGELLKNIENCALKMMKKMPLMVAKHPVGLEKAFQNFERTIDSDQKVQMVGIVGMGGAGKTTLAKEIYNRKCSSFYRRSFLFEVRDAAAKQELHNKQKKLLADIGFQYSQFDNVEEGRGILASSLQSLCILLVLDDVDHQDQLDALLPEMGNLASGSLVIVTSRESGVLTSWGISSIYKMEGLSPSSAEQLLCWHAFRQPYPVEGFEEVMEKVLNACNGLPLSLKVIGAQPYGRSVDNWKSLLHKISRILPRDIKKSLKVSYDALDEEEQEMFLDIACFFIGEKLSLAIAVWDGSGWSGECNWDTLVSKCLVEVNENNCIKMHDQLRDLGKEIASKHSPLRLWSPEQISDFGKQTQGGILVRGLIAAHGQRVMSGTVPHWLGLNQKQNTSGLVGRHFSPELKLLVVSGDCSNEEFAKLSADLVWLRWIFYRDPNLLSLLSLQNLRVLELYQAEAIKFLWKDKEPPLQLRELIISWSSKANRFPGFPRSIGCLKHLKKISFVGRFYTPFRNLPSEFCFLQSLEHLELINCTQLCSLPTDFGDLTELRHIDLSRCCKLKTLPNTFMKLIRLQYLNLSNCSKLAFTSKNLDMLKNMKNLKYLNFEGCHKLKELPRQITNQASLGVLILESTSLRELPCNIGQLSKLEELKIGSSFLTSLPASIGNLFCLTTLKIEMCVKLESLPEAPWKLPELQDLRIDSCPIRELPFGSSSLCKLKEIKLSKTEVSKVSISQDCCRALEKLSLSSNNFLTEIKTLPTTVKSIVVLDCRMLKKIESIGGLKNLEYLGISKCPELDELQSFADAVSLKELEIIECPKLDTLPSFAQLSSLKTFTMIDCDKVEKVEGLKHLRSIERLKIETSKVIRIQSLKQADRLRTVEIKADSISALIPCIQTIQLKKWPPKMEICGRAVDVVDVESLVEPLLLSNISIVDSFQKVKIGNRERPNRLRFKTGQKSSSNAAILCLLSSCFGRMKLRVDSNRKRVPGVALQEGKWVWIGVYTQASKEYQIYDYNKSRNEVEGMLMTGEQGRIVEAFYQLLSRVGN